MEFYKKNPEIPGTIFVQGEAIDDEKVVCGEKFKPFADPNTFPGRPPKLVKVEGKELNRGQIDDVQKQAKKQANEPPKHLGVIKSAQFVVNKETGEAKLKAEPKLPPEAKPKKVVEPEPKEEVELGEEAEAKEEAEPVIEEQKSKGSRKISEMYSTEDIVEVFPGITDKNADQFSKKFSTLMDVVHASNVDLKKIGVPSNYFRRLRDKAVEIIESDDK